VLSKDKQTLDQTADLIDDEVVKFSLCVEGSYEFGCRRYAVMQVTSQCRYGYDFSPLRWLFVRN
jgi:hypothetical protein